MRCRSCIVWRGQGTEIASTQVAVAPARKVGTKTRLAGDRIYQGVSPVEGVILHAKVVTGKVAGRVAKIVVLVPEDPLAPWWCRDNFHLHRQLHS